VTLGRDELVELIRRGDPLAAARGLPEARTIAVRWTGADDEPRDDDTAIVSYGAGMAAEEVADRLLALAHAATETGSPRSVVLAPVEGTAQRPGSWGVEDLTVVAAARRALPRGVRVRPDWRRLGPGLCQVATAFGADEWVLPEAEPADPAVLAEAMGRELAR
jgi:hypothetical protein